jgi:hypothetical protein
VTRTDSRATVERRDRAGVLEGSEVGHRINIRSGLNTPLHVLLAERRRRRDGLRDTCTLRSVLNEDGGGCLGGSGDSNSERVTGTDLGCRHGRRGARSEIEERCGQASDCTPQPLKRGSTYGCR